MYIRRKFRRNYLVLYLAGVMAGLLLVSLNTPFNPRTLADKITLRSFGIVYKNSKCTDGRSLYKTNKDKLEINSNIATDKTFKVFLEEKGDNVSMTQPKDVMDEGRMQLISSVTTKQFRPNQPKFIMSYFYREQLTGAIVHLAYLTGVAKEMNRKVVTPFTAHSYIIGTPGDSQHRREDIGGYFDVKAMNQTLTENNYSSLATYAEFEKVCQNQLGVLIFFLYRRSLAYNWMINQIKEKEYPSIENITAETEKAGYLDCTWMQPLWMKSQNYYGDSLIARKILCVDEERVKSSEQLENILNKDHVEPCVGIYRWAGNTYQPMKLYFDVHPVKSEVTIHDFYVSSVLQKKAEDFVTENIQGEYIAVHIRLEYFSLIRKYEHNTTWTNLRQSNEYKFLIETLKNTSIIYRDMKRKYPSIKKTFMATDLSQYGSTSLLATRKSREFISILAELKALLTEVFEDPVVYNVTDHNADRGKVALVESEILSRGSALFIVGGGKFQKEFVVEKFLRRHNRDVTRIHHGYIDPNWYKIILGPLEMEKKSKIR